MLGKVDQISNVQQLKKLEEKTDGKKRQKRQN